MSKRITPNRYRLYYIPARNTIPSRYVLHDFKSNKSISEDKTLIFIHLFPRATLLHTFEKHPGSFEDIRRDYPELFI